MRKLYVLGLGLLALAAARAGADPFPVEYAVDENFLKANVVAGQTIDVELHLDAGCTAAIATAQLAVDDAGVVFDRLTRINVKGV
jgi:hypothetical protein